MQGSIDPYIELFIIFRSTLGRKHENLLKYLFYEHQGRKNRSRY